MKGMEDLAILGLFNCFFVYFEAISEAADATWGHGFDLKGHQKAQNILKSNETVEQTSEKWKE